MIGHGNNYDSLPAMSDLEAKFSEIQRKASISKEQTQKLLHTFHKMKEGIDKFSSTLHREGGDSIKTTLDSNDSSDEKVKAYEKRIKSLEDTLRKAYSELRTMPQVLPSEEMNHLIEQNSDLKTEIEIVQKA